MTSAIRAGCLAYIRFLTLTGGPTSPLPILTLRSYWFNKNSNSILYIAIRAHQSTILQVLASKIRRRHNVAGRGYREFRVGVPTRPNPTAIDAALNEGQLDPFRLLYEIRENPKLLIRTASNTTIQPLLNYLTPRRYYQLSGFADKALTVSI